VRGLVVANPGQALALLAELDRRFPESAFAEERASLVIDALVKLGDIGQARTRSEEFFARFPRGRFGLHVETLTGVHPRPTIGEDP
jgi:outer membrane protein assembly factor BamD (BamD/ComL family)